MVYVETNPTGSPFAFTGYAESDFSAPSVDGLWHEANGGRVRLNDAGYLVIAKMVARTLSRLVA
jgi:hypothetical protein